MSTAYTYLRAFNGPTNSSIRNEYPCSRYLARYSRNLKANDTPRGYLIAVSKGRNGLSAENRTQIARLKWITVQPRFAQRSIMVIGDYLLFLFSLSFFLSFYTSHRQRRLRRPSRSQKATNSRPALILLRKSLDRYLPVTRRLSRKPRFATVREREKRVNGCM